MKKFLAMMLAVLMLLSMATVAFADEGKSGYTDVSYIELKKKVSGNNSPAATYVFDITPLNGAPQIGDGTITYQMDANTTSLSQTVYLPGVDPDDTTGKKYTKVGVYEYKIKERAENLPAGVTADPSTYLLKVTVVYDETDAQLKRQANQLYRYKSDETLETVKVDAFTNNYTSSTLTVKKAVVTNNADHDKSATASYSIKVKLTGVNSNTTYQVYKKNADGQYIADGSSESVTNETDFTVNLTHDGYVVISNIPEYTKYTVTESTISAPATASTKDGYWVWTKSGEVTTDTEIAVGTDANNEVTITNTFEWYGDVIVKKTVKGNMGDQTLDFNFTVTLKNVDTNKFDVTGWTVNENSTYSKTFTLKHGETEDILKLPYGTEYVVTETAVEGYTTKVDGVETNNVEAKVMNPSVTHEFVNDKETAPDTGVSLDTLPYVLVLALAGAGLVLMIARKRRVED